MLFDSDFFREGVEQLFPGQSNYFDSNDNLVIEQRIKTLFELIYKWNRTHNLTSIANPREFIIKHLFDSLILLRFIQRASIKKPLSLLDVGSGAGFPGIPLAIFRHDIDLTSIDANQKKVAFQNTVIRQLELTNVKCQHSRIEDITNMQKDIVTARAFSSLSNIIEYSARLLNKSGKWLLMKGTYPAQEIEALQKSELNMHIGNLQVHSLNVPFLDAERHLVEISAT